MENLDRWRKSRALLERARQSLAGGVSSPFRAKAPIPLYFEDGCGCRLRDVDGNEYIDYALAWGPLILGHRHPALVAVMQRQAGRPHLYGAQHELEYEAAERIQRTVPCAERVAFTSSGSEAVQLALRMARAFTGRNLILKFEGHYHGWMDSILISYHPTGGQCGDPNCPTAVAASAGQVPNALDNVLVCPWNRIDLLRDFMRTRGPEIAAVITEPVLCNSGCLMPEPGFLAELREACTANGSLLIFDEVITGFRIALGGAQEKFGVTPDIATLGKAIAGGAPLSAIAGRKEVFDLMYGGGVAFGGTFNGNPVSMASACTTLDELGKDAGEAVKSANRAGEKLQAGIAACARKRGIPLTITGFGTAFSLHFTECSSLMNYRDVLEDDVAKLNRFLFAALQEGVYLLPDGRFYVSAVHRDSDIHETIAAIDRAFSAL